MIMMICVAKKGIIIKKGREICSCCCYTGIVLVVDVAKNKMNNKSCQVIFSLKPILEEMNEPSSFLSCLSSSLSCSFLLFSWFPRNESLNRQMKYMQESCFPSYAEKKGNQQDENLSCVYDYALLLVKKGRERESERKKERQARKIEFAVQQSQGERKVIWMRNKTIWRWQNIWLKILWGQLSGKEMPFPASLKYREKRVTLSNPVMSVSILSPCL